MPMKEMEPSSVIKAIAKQMAQDGLNVNALKFKNAADNLPFTKVLNGTRYRLERDRRIQCLIDDSGLTREEIEAKTLQYWAYVQEGEDGEALKIKDELWFRGILILPDKTWTPSSSAGIYDKSPFTRKTKAEVLGQ